MTRDTIALVAKLTWLLPLIYIFTNRFVGLAIGAAAADFLIFPIGVAALPISLYCLFQIRRHGRRGILGHATAGFLLASIVLAIWIPNFLYSLERARVAAEAKKANVSARP